jgi:hypothetical protein
MLPEAEILSFDLRFEGCRLRNKAVERELIASIMENGIREPLQVVEKEGVRIILNGFKRYRCAVRLGIGIVPYSILSGDEADGIVKMLRISNNNGLNILEQARFVDELKIVYHMDTTDIAAVLEKSKAWVSVRSGIMREMSRTVQEHIFSGRFPVYAYMYILRPFMRINKIGVEEIDDFVRLIGGRNLSIRDIELLAHGYLQGGDAFRREIEAGNIALGLRTLKGELRKPGGCTQQERSLIKDLEITGKYMQRVICKCKDPRHKTGDFFVQANLLAGGILRQIQIFNESVQSLYDRSGKA